MLDRKYDRWILALMLMIGLVVLPVAAFAACQTHSVMSPGGKIVFCTTCCYGGHCSTTCREGN